MESENPTRPYLVHKGVKSVIHVLNFNPPNRNAPGKITFMIPYIRFDLNERESVIFHDNRKFRFQAENSHSDLKMNSTVTGYVY